MKFNIDGALCISISNRADRRETLKSEFAKLDHDVDFHLVERDHEKPYRGCLTSHMQCAQIALDKGWENVLILEDDVQFVPPKPEVIDNLNRFIKTNDWDILLLGMILTGAWLTPYKNVARARGTATHAYIIPARTCEKIVKWQFEDVGMSPMVRRYLKRHVALPYIARQACETESDLETQKANVNEIRSDFWETMRWKQYYYAYLRYGHRSLFKLRQ